MTTLFEVGKSYRVYPGKVYTVQERTDTFVTFIMPSGRTLRGNLHNVIKKGCGTVRRYEIVRIPNSDTVDSREVIKR